MSAVETVEKNSTPSNNSSRPPFKYLIVIEPLGFLYGSAGKFLSPENLVGRSGSSFPPSAAALSGLFAAYYKGDEKHLKNLQLAGSFWAWSENPQNFYVPTPFNCLIKSRMTKRPPFNRLVKTGTVTQQLQWQNSQEQNNNKESPGYWLPSVSGKFDKGSWVAIQDWKFIQFGLPSPPVKIAVEFSPWEYTPHLHPRLKEDERRVDEDLERGSLFLENAVQLNPDACLVYLSNTELKNDWYRFGGEGHMVDVKCVDLSPTVQDLLNQPVGKSFALITPGVWGSNRLSKREPVFLEKGNKQKYEQENPESNETKVWSLEGLITERPIPFRYRLGNRENQQLQEEQHSQAPKLLSRGRYAVPAGTVYVVEDSINQSWQQWDDKWFPKEGPSLKRWGCGLALPLPNAIALWAAPFGSIAQSGL
ncbi:type III-B CRISPR module-associated Cmr3 family protein [Mastigocladopsis repens]|uniref:type III-B CRISPR module-associated Cmr3 family protein n=1 Tax=Mastigocladopsis repens TaxID=221287 RepID=UPI0002D94A31|nr:type III-B CRISPR module-associated Cmr3 family protein [Mastigocladopsis repens]